MRSPTPDTIEDALGATATATAPFIVIGDAPEGEEQIRSRLPSSGASARASAYTRARRARSSPAPQVHPATVRRLTLGGRPDHCARPGQWNYAAIVAPQIIFVPAADGKTPRSATFNAKIVELFDDPADNLDPAPGTTDTLPVAVSVAPAIVVLTVGITLTELATVGAFSVSLSREPASHVVIDGAASAGSLPTRRRR